MAKVITSMLKFSPDQAQKVLEKEDSKSMVSVDSSPLFLLQLTICEGHFSTLIAPLIGLTSLLFLDSLGCDES